jgi:hypothetical protein
MDVGLLGELPAKGMLPSTGSDDEDAHGAEDTGARPGQIVWATCDE